MHIISTKRLKKTIMNIKIENLGPVKSADIDLNKRLILLCGPNNTGKTYMSYVIYALCRSHSYSEDVISEEDIRVILENKSIEIEINYKEIFKVKNSIAESIKDTLDDIFGISNEDKQNLFKSFNLTIPSSEEICKQKMFEIICDTNFTVAGLNFNIKKENQTNNVIITPDDSNNYSVKDVPIFIYQTIIGSNIYKSLALYPLFDAAIFPVERNSIYTFNKELSLSRNALVDQLQRLQENYNTPQILDSILRYKFISLRSIIRGDQL